MARQYNDDGICNSCGLEAKDHVRMEFSLHWHRGHCPDSSLPIDPKEDDPWDPKYQPEAPVSQLFDPLE